MCIVRERRLAVFFRLEMSEVCFSVKSLILLIWDTRKNKLYGDQDDNGETSGCFCSCPLTGDLSSSACVCGCTCVVNGVSATAVT